jgi:hypothetical protein
MRKDIENKNQKLANVEFGMEFGDINAGKQYEIPFMNKNKKVRKSK